MKEYKKVFKLFLAGQEDKEIKWLEDMSKMGYQLVNISFATYYTFKKEEGKNYTYMIDMKGRSVIDDNEYIDMYEDQGFEYIDKTHEYYYFRCDIKSDAIKLIKNDEGRYLGRINVQKNVLLFGVIANIFIAIINLCNFNTHHNYVNMWIPSMNLLVGIICLAAYINIKKKIRELRYKGVKEPYSTNSKDWTGFLEANVVFTVVMVICIIGALSIILF